ncbi:MAG: ATP-binding cassette domain-containing protein [Firmicutes bacterium]|nr:ATP-binding cassette domain-containing protein [Bacillota bacterium]
MNDVVLAAQGVGKVVGGRRILWPLSLTLRSQRLLVIQGPNGAGKSSLLRILAGRWSRTEGQLHWFGRPVAREGQVDARVGYLGHESLLSEHFDLRENLRLYAWLWRLPDRLRRIEEALDLTGLRWCASDPLYVYSQGMRQRAEWARIILVQPRLLLLDEPLSHVETDRHNPLCRWVSDQLKRGASAVITTHDAGEWQSYADGVARLQGGRWRAWEPMREVGRA